MNLKETYPGFHIDDTGAMMYFVYGSTNRWFVGFRYDRQIGNLLYCDTVDYFAIDDFDSAQKTLNLIVDQIKANLRLLAPDTKLGIEISQNPTRCPIDIIVRSGVPEWLESLNSTWYTTMEKIRS